MVSDCDYRLDFYKLFLLSWIEPSKFSLFGYEDVGYFLWETVQKMYLNANKFNADQAVRLGKEFSLMIWYDITIVSVWKLRIVGWSSSAQGSTCIKLFTLYLLLSISLSVQSNGNLSGSPFPFLKCLNWGKFHATKSLMEDPAACSN